MDPKHKEIAEGVYEAVSFSLAETGNETTLFVIIKDNETMPILIPPGVEIDTAGYTLTSMHYAKEHDADAIVVVSNMWVVLEHIDNLDPDVRPSEHPNKEHYLNLIYMTADGSESESIAGKVEMAGGIKFIREWQWIDAIQTFEWFQPWR